MKNTPEDSEKQFFRNRFDDFASEPDEKVWKNIRTRLPKPAGRYRLVAVAALLLLAVAALLVWQTGSHENTETAPGKIQQGSRKTRPDTEKRPVETVGQTENTTVGQSGGQTAVHPPANNDGLQGNFALKPEEKQTETGDAQPDTSMIVRKTSELPEKSGNTRVTTARNNLGGRSHNSIHTNKKQPTDTQKTKPEKTGKYLKHTANSEPDSVFANRFGEGKPENRNNTRTGRVTAAKNTRASHWANEPLQTLAGKSIGLAAYEPLLQTREITFHAPPSVPEIVSPEKPKPWQMQIGFMPLLNYYNVMPVRTDSILVGNFQLGNAVDARRLGWQVQAGFSRQFSQRISLRMGFVYAQQQQNIVYQTRSSFPVSSVVTSVNDQEIRVLHTYAEQTRQIQNRQQSFGLRLDALYGLHQGALLRHYLVGGIQATGSRINGLGNGTEASIQAGYGVAVTAGRNLSFWAEPTLRYSLRNRFDPSKTARFRTNGAGLQFGMTLKLGNRR